MSVRKGKEDRNMSMTEIIDDMTQEMVGSDGFERYMSAPLPHNNQGYVQRDYKTGNLYVCCPRCSKKNFMITEETKIHKLPWRCKGSGCRKEFEVNI